MKGRICLIEKFALHDGPGIRTVIFFKGCPLRCLWCSNPETQEVKNQIYFDKNKCISCDTCNRCKNICHKNAIFFKDGIVKFDYSKCDFCGECLKKCHKGALNFVSKEIDLKDVFEEIRKDEPFYKNSGGGVTASGGEVLLHTDFIYELFKMCKDEYINTAIETTGFGKFEDLEKLVKYTDYILYDIKHINNDIHLKLTGVGNKLIIDNLKKISKSHKNIVIRIPLIKGINNSQENIEEVIKLAKECNIDEIHLLPYHTLGLGKYNQLSKEYKFGSIDKLKKSEITFLKGKIELESIKCVVGG